MATRVIPLSEALGGPAGTKAYSVARTSGSTEISAKIVDLADPVGAKGVEVTYPDNPTRNLEAEFAVTLKVQCQFEADVFRDDVESFKVTVSASENRQPVFTIGTAAMRFTSATAMAQTRAGVATDADGNPVVVRIASSDTNVATVEIEESATIPGRWQVTVTPAGLGSALITAIPNDGIADGAAVQWLVTVGDPCRDLSVMLSPIPNQTFAHNTGPHDVAVAVASKSANANDPTLAVARRSGSSDISAAIVDGQVRVTVPSSSNANARSAVFRVTATSACESNAATTTTHHVDFAVTVPAGEDVPDVPSAPGLSLARTGDDVTATVTAPESGPDPTSYEVQRSASSVFSTITDTKTLNAAGNIQFIDLPVGTHYFRARAINAAGGGAWSATRIATVPQAVPNAPTIRVTAVVGGAQYVVISPESGPTPLQYEVQYDDNGSFTSPASVPNVTHPPPTAGVVRTLPAGTWYWRARAVLGSSARSPWSPVASVVLSGSPTGPPNAPGIAVAHDAGMNPTRTTVTITAPAEGAAPVGYQLRRWNRPFVNDNDGSQTIPAELSAPGSHVYTGLSGLWYFRVRGWNLDRFGGRDYSPWSGTIIRNWDVAPTVSYDDDTPEQGSDVVATLSHTRHVSNYSWHFRASEDSESIWNVPGGDFTDTTLTVPSNAPVGRQYRVAWRRTGIGLETGPWITVIEGPPPVVVPPVSAPTVTITQSGRVQVVLEVSLSGGAYDEVVSAVWGDLGPDGNPITGSRRFVTRPGGRSEIYSVTVTVRGTGTLARVGTATARASITLMPSGAFETRVTYSTNAPEQGEQVTATSVPVGSRNIRWQARNTAGQWQNIGGAGSNTRTLTILPTDAVGRRYRITWEDASGNAYVATNSVVVARAVLSTTDVPVITPSGRSFAFTPHPGAAQYQIEQRFNRTRSWRDDDGVLQSAPENYGWSSLATGYSSGAVVVPFNGGQARVRLRNDDGSVVTNWSPWHWVNGDVELAYGRLTGQRWNVRPTDPTNPHAYLADGNVSVQGRDTDHELIDTGPNVYAFQWQRKAATSTAPQDQGWSDIAGATTDTYRIPSGAPVGTLFRLTYIITGALNSQETRFVTLYHVKKT